jgi:hypothetical protein
MMWLFYKAAAAETDHRHAFLLSLISISFLDIATYNTMFFVCALVVYMILKEKRKPLIYSVMGAVATCAALSRQTSGTLLLITGIILLVVSVSKEQRRKAVLSYLAGTAAICFCFLFYLLGTKTFAAFWDYCFFAIFKTDGNSAVNPDGIPALVITLIGGALDLFRYRKDHNKNNINHLIVGLTVFTVGIPIVDQMHMVYTGMWFALPLVKLFKDLFESKTTKLIWMTCDIGAVSLSLLFTFMSFRGSVFVNDIDELKYVPLTSDIRAFQDIAQINDLYEENGYKVTVFAQESALISIIDGEFNPPYDLFLKGNLGLNDPLAYAEEACNSENSIILITDNYQESDWEAPDGIEEYIKSHCHPIYSYSQYVWYMPDQ